MSSHRHSSLLILAVSLVLALCVPANAQGSVDLISGDRVPLIAQESVDLLSGETVSEELADLISTDQAASAPVPQKATPADDNDWHLGISPYLWFAGVHGNVGARGYTASVHASATDVLSHFNIGLMGAVEARKKRFVAPVDYMWIKLSDDKAFPGVGDLGADSIKAKMTSSILTPKVGYRFADYVKLQADALVGIRYWHLGTNLTLEPSSIQTVTQSANWVDVVAGAKFVMPLSPKAMITVLGDAGGGGASVDYQVAGLLGYKVKPTVTLQAGWRYLDVNYRPNSSFIYDVAQTGLLLGVTFNVK
jgi:hypothetical protein